MFKFYFDFLNIWYQGEANIMEPDYYACILLIRNYYKSLLLFLKCAQPAMIQDWRGYLSSGYYIFINFLAFTNICRNQFPFFFVQLAPFNATDDPAYIVGGNHAVSSLRTVQLNFYYLFNLLIYINFF